MSYFSISYSKQKDYSMTYLHSHDFYELYFQLSGTRRYFYDNQYYDLTENSLVTIPPHVLHKFETGPYERIAIYFTTDKLPPEQATLLTMLTKKCVIEFPEKETKQIHKTLHKIYQLFTSETINDKHLQLSLWVGYLLHQLYYANATEKSETLRLTNDLDNKDLSPTILKIMDYIKTRYNASLSLAEVCQAFHLSKAWICKAFSKANGMTIFQYKISLQLNKAKDLLRTTTQPIEKIAKTTGFSSPNYFCKVFKKNTGSTPLEFRHASRKQRPTSKDKTADS